MGEVDEAEMNKFYQDKLDEDFIANFKCMQTDVYICALEHGWWEDEPVGENAELYKRMFDGEKIALIHSEISEALENSRAGSPPDDKIPEFTGVEAEFADAIIRIMDLAERRGLRVAEALVAKAKFNKGREYKHGKRF